MKNKKIVLPKGIQKEMLKFFMLTSIPKIIKQSPLSEVDKGEENERERKFKSG